MLFLHILGFIFSSHYCSYFCKQILDKKWLSREIWEHKNGMHIPVYKNGKCPAMFTFDGKTMDTKIYLLIISYWWFENDVIKNMIRQRMINLPKILVWSLWQYKVSLYQIWSHLDKWQQSYRPNKLRDFLLCYGLLGILLPKCFPNL